MDQYALMDEPHFVWSNDVLPDGVKFYNETECYTRAMIYDAFLEWERRRREDPEPFTRPDELSDEDVACEATEYLCALMDEADD